MMVLRHFRASMISIEGNSITVISWLKNDANRRNKIHYYPMQDDIWRSASVTIYFLTLYNYQEGYKVVDWFAGYAPMLFRFFYLFFGVSASSGLLIELQRVAC